MAFQSFLSSVLLLSSMLRDAFLDTKLFRLCVYFVPCPPLLLLPQIFPLNICFSSPSGLFICPKNCSCLFLMGIFCIRPFPLLILLTSFQSMKFSLSFCCFKSSFKVFCQCPAFTSMEKDEPCVGFQSVDFGVNLDISVGEDGLHLGECVFRQTILFLFLCRISRLKLL